MNRFPSIAVGIAACLAPQVITAVADTLFVGDWGAGATSTSGSIFTYDTTVGGASQATFAGQLYTPGGMAFDSQGDLYVSIGEQTSTAGKILKFASDVSSTLFASGLNTPSGLAFDSAGNLKVGLSGGNAIDSISPDGVVSPFATLASGSKFIYGLAYDASGVLYCASRLNGGSVTEFNSDGSQKATFATAIGAPFAIAFDAAGNVFVDDAGSGRIFKFNPDGTGKTVFASGLSVPTGMAFDSAGNLYVAEATGGVIDKFDSSGNKTTFATGLTTPWFVSIGKTAVPEPSTLALLLLGAGTIAFAIRKPRA